MAKKLRSIHRSKSLTADEKAKYDKIRGQVMREFPPTQTPKQEPAPRGVGATIRKARKAAGLSYYAVAKKAGIPNSTTVKDIEYGRDAKLSNIQAIAKVLGLKVELVEMCS